MGQQGPRRGSLQFWPRKRADKALPRVNWNVIRSDNKKEKNLLGFIGYKVGMTSAYVKDSTPDAMTKNKKIIVPATILECPTIKILSVRFIKNKKIVKEVLNDNLDKELKKKIKFPKEYKTKEKLEKLEKEQNYDDVDVIVYSQSKKTNIKKTPDVAEIGLGGNKEDKLAFIKENLQKEISISDVFKSGLVDIRGITKGKGFQGPVKRFGIELRVKKSEKGQRKPGSIGPTHPRRLTFRVPRPGQMGYSNRIVYNCKIISVGKISDLNTNKQQRFFHYGDIKSDFIILRGSVQGPCKRQLMICRTLRPTKKQLKKNYELIELR